MKKLLKAILLLAFVGLVAAAVASYVSKKKLEAMSDEEIREFLAQKLQGKVGDEQLESIQNSVIAGVRKTKAAVGEAEEAAEDAVDAAGEAAEEAADAVAAVAESADEDSTDDVS